MVSLSLSMALKSASLLIKEILQLLNCLIVLHNEGKHYLPIRFPLAPLLTKNAIISKSSYFVAKQTVPPLFLFTLASLFNNSRITDK